MDQNLKQSTIDNLTKAQAILIVVDQNAGTGGVAAGLALMLACEKLGKNASIVAKNPTVSDAQKLYGVDKIGKTQGSQNLVISISNAVETVDRVSHYLDGDNLKLTLHAFPGSSGPNKNEVSFSQEMVEPDVIFAIGFQNEEEMKQNVSHVQNIAPTTWLVNISRQDMGQIFAQVNVFDPNSSGLSEITAQLVADLALPMDEDIAFNLYQGILEETRQFNPGTIGPKTFEIASWLVKFGAGNASFASTSDSESGRASFAGGNQPSTPQPAMAKPSFQMQNMADPIQPQFNIPSVSNSYPPMQTQQVSSQAQPINHGEIIETPIQQVERETVPSAASASGDDWLQPPKIYKGSKSFDTKE
jgi:hypothetical protein